MSVSVKAVTARKAHLCDDCQWSFSLRGVATILPGHRYLRHVAFPGDESHGGTVPWVARECIACAAGRDETAPMLLANACSSYCCSTTPCALPLRHVGDHACRDCSRATPP